MVKINLNLLNFMLPQKSELFYLIILFWYRIKVYIRSEEISPGAFLLGSIYKYSMMVLNMLPFYGGLI